MMIPPIGGDSGFFLNMYTRYLRDPHSVPPDWAVWFAEMEPSRGGPPDASRSLQDYALALQRLGHREAALDPLALTAHLDAELETLRSALAGRQEEVEVRMAGDVHRMPVSQAVALLDGIYRGPIGIELAHLEDPGDRAWLASAFEAAMLAGQDPAATQAALESIILADEFESFMRVKFPTKKRFGSEGSEGSLAFSRALLDQALKDGIRNVVIGGMHRGRLAFLAVALGKSLGTLAAELMGRDLSEGAEFTGDVPYHLGYRAKIESGDASLELTLLPHPSHLLVVAPVALGMARATAGSLCFLMHTDAAFSGQGLAAEILQMSGLEGYRVGGTIHLVVNNQIGFTTLPSEGRTARYCTDAAKMIGVPVFHVNGDNPVAVARAAQLAMAWRKRTGKDAIVDLICYRRYGHNELDEPRFTQPGMWRQIDLLPPLREQFEKDACARFPQLRDTAAAVAAQFRERLRDGFNIADGTIPNDEPVQQQSWAALALPGETGLLEPVNTGLPLKTLRELGLRSCAIPAQIEANQKVRRFYEQRADSLISGVGINFATAEAMAIATLVAEGTPVRLSGQDSVRGTFTQRHMVVHDVPSGNRIRPTVQDTPDLFEIINSPLSEYGVLGFEYGHSLRKPDALTIWEAQFGDFLNGAQIVVDQYIVSAEAKWRLKSGLVVLLPHGLEGQGPDHSSARIERLTQMAAGGNIIIANPSTPANLFHLLRRQIHAPWRKPLFVIAPKSLLRAKAAVSTLEEMGPGRSFLPLIAEGGRSKAVKRLVICSGKIAYALEQARAEAGRDSSVHILRVEQIYPLPLLGIQTAIAESPGAELFWLQEEPANQGAWPFVSQRLAEIGITSIRLVARPSLPVTAAGSVERHEREQAGLLAAALGI